MKKKLGIVSYNIYCNFTNYGSILQSWALSQVIKRFGYKPIVVDYCPDILKKVNPLNPFSNMWDKDLKNVAECRLSLPAIQENYYKFENFYQNHLSLSLSKYSRDNFEKVMDEVDAFVVGADTVFCIDEFGFDDGYYANYDCMKHNSVSYSASFGDAIFNEVNTSILKERLQNFNALAIREKRLLSTIKELVTVECEQTLDPTLLLEENDYQTLLSKDKQTHGEYILYYSRYYNKEMELFVENLSKKYSLQVVEISLRYSNREKGYIMRYDAGIEEFLSLVKNAKYVVTNSYHGVIFSIIYKRQFYCFERIQCFSKIRELLEIFNLEKRIVTVNPKDNDDYIDYDNVYKILNKKRDESLNYLKWEIENCL